MNQSSGIDSHALGRIGEEAASIWLEKHGYRVTGRNIRIGHAEIDLLAEDDRYLVFVEVKTRRQTADEKSRYGSPASAVDAKKQSVLLAAAERYYSENNCEKIPRLDVMEVYVSPAADLCTVTEIRHFENAIRKKSKFGR